jgi:sulfoxide reductase heme-binding subunit YedZ
MSRILFSEGLGQMGQAVEAQVQAGFEARRRQFRWSIFAAALMPAAALVYWTFTGDLTANPIDFITDTTGTTALTMLVCTLTVTPLRRVTGRNELSRLRRMLGLFAFFYGSLHMLTWVVIDWFFDVASMVTDVTMRPFITMGMTTFLLLLPLAVTSTAGWIRRLGKRWTQLHRLVYVAAVTAVIHFWWVVKADFRQPRLWALALCVLFAFRAWWTLQPRFRPF